MTPIEKLPPPDRIITTPDRGDPPNPPQPAPEPETKNFRGRDAAPSGARKRYADGGMAKKGYAAGGVTRADGIVAKGHTKGKMV
jgi:hypothetical protein